MHPIQKMNMEEEAKNIERCRNDPEFMATGMCPVCVMDHPCLCDKDAAISEMRSYYEKNRRTWWGRREPKLTGSWGRNMDGLMDELYRIATSRWKEQRTLQKQTKKATKKRA